MPSIAADREDAASRRRGGRGLPRQSNFNALLVFVIVVLSLMMGAGGYMLYEVQERLTATGDLLRSASGQISELERRLAATDEGFARTGSVVDDRLKTNESEIRKLWDVSNKRNKDWIQENQQAVTRLASRIDELAVGIKETGDTVGRMNAGFDALRQGFTDFRRELMLENEGMATEVAAISERMQSSERALAELAGRADDAEEAIEAIDAHRRQINQVLVELQQRLGEQRTDDGGGDAGGDDAPVVEAAVPSGGQQASDGGG